MPSTHYRIQLDSSGLEWLRFRATTDKGQVIDFTVQYETVIDGEVHPVIRYDCAHGFAHRDVLDRTGAQIAKRPLPPRSSLGEALTWSRDDLLQNWPTYRERFFGAPS